MRICLFIWFVLIAEVTLAKDIRIGLFESSPVKSIVVKYNIGRYDLFSESMQFPTMQESSEKLTVKVNGDKVQVIKNDELLGNFRWFRLSRRSPENSLKLFPYGKERRYKGDIIFYSYAGHLQVVNEIDLEKYVEGAVKGEVGYGYNEEYYKVQAVISRTYALFMHKHEEEGFDLCDHTHCQVYKGINYDEKIERAVNFTVGQVIINQDLSSINTLFHSNCGGRTSTTDYVWSKRLDNLEPVYDSHCRKSSQANWKKTIDKNDWVDYLSNRLNKTPEEIKNQTLDFTQGVNRKKNYQVGGEYIKLTEIRSFFRLKSTFFSVTDIGDKVVLTGKGFGHGVGLCQEGAIAMSKTGYSYKDILKFYYSNIFLLDEQAISFYMLF